MTTLAFRFPGGRYHATPWGHQVNEGLVEWPPCPWRLLRALLNAGYTRLGWGEAVPPEAGVLLEKFAGVLPSYTLPPASVAHSRHYMPILGGKTTLVMDTWANTGGDLFVHWPLDLSADEWGLLARLVGALNYLGRSESWIEGRLLAGDRPAPAPNCFPFEPGAQVETSGDFDLVDLLSPLPAETYAAWRQEQAPPLQTDGRKPTAKERKEHAKREEPFPRDLLDCLQWDTAKWKGFGWNLPPGSRMVQYQRPREALEATGAAPPPRTASRPLCDIVLVALATPSGNLSALPVTPRTLPQAELLHKALVGRAGQHADVPAVLSGCGDDHRPLRGHAHAHVLPVDLDQDGHIDHVLLWAPVGFGPEALRTVRGVRHTWMKGGAGELQVAVAGLGFRDRLVEMGGGLERLLGPPDGACEWVSATPFVPPRHMKRNGRNSLEGQVQAELASRELPAAIRVERLSREDEQRLRFRHFVRVRARGGVPPPVDCGLGLRLVLVEPARGPLCLGYASHFGLGLFAAVD
jgi:CRISPR-associated protein Csb2